VRRVDFVGQLVIIDRCAFAGAAFNRRSMLSVGMLAARHFRSTIRNRGFMPGSPPPSLAAMLISLASFEKIFPRLASKAPLKCLTLDHLLCPDIGLCWSANGSVHAYRLDHPVSSQFKSRG